jgi:hypothetical protein
MRRTLIWIVVSSAAAGAIAVYHHDTAELARLHRDVVSLRSRDGDPRPAGAISFAGVRDDRPGDLQPAPAQPTRGDEHRADDGDDRSAAAGRSNTARWDDEARANQQAVEDTFAAQAVDPAWATRAAVDIREHLGALAVPPSSSLGNVDCRGSMCRVEMVSRDRDLMKQFMDRAFGVTAQSPWTGPVMADYQPANSDGTAVVVLYLGRNGTSLFTSPP